jgi:hydroxymethylbilane synthase
VPAAQGCIALEFRKDDLKVKKVLNKINHIPSMEDCLMERKYLSKWGGGCALDIGVTIENFLNNKVLFSRGRDANTKKYFKEKKYLNNINSKKVKNVFPSKLSKYQMFQRELNDFSKKLDNKNLLLTRG